jgi:chloride channel protein, CIC family
MSRLAGLRRRLRRLPEHPAVRRIRGLASADRTRDPMMLALAAAVGLGTGLLAVALVWLIATVQRLVWVGLPDPILVVVVPTAGAFAVGLLLRYWLPEAHGSGVSQLMTAIALHGGRVRPALAFGKVITAGLALGTGASGGRESPIVQVGGSVGSSLGRMFALTEDQKRALIAGGAGAGIAASFNAPIAGMMFALEVIIGGFRARYLQVVVVACVVASVTAREIIGEDLIYRPPGYRVGVLRELGSGGIVLEFVLYTLLGLAAVLVGVGLIRGVDGATRLSERWQVWPPLRLAAGGLGVGLIALAVPEVLGTGDDLPPVLGVVREPIAGMLDGTLGQAGWDGIAFLLLLVVAKLAATCCSVGTGNSVGSFAPAIFMGAALGSAFGQAAATLLPEAGVRPGAFALVGMAATLGATSRAPLTAILIAFELTGSYGLVLPLMLATGISTFVSDRVHPGSIHTTPLLRRGIVYAEPEDVDIMQTVRVGEIMTTDPATVPASMTLAELIDTFAATRHHGFPVVDGDRLVGVVTLADLASPDATGLDRDSPTVGDVCSRRVVTVTPEDPMFRALRRMAALDVGRIPVVSAEDHGRLVGLVRRSDIVTAYQRAVTRSLGAQQRRDSSRLRDLAGTQFVELVMDDRAPAAGKQVRDVDWPERTVLTSINRLGDVVMPNGNTILEAGDVVTVLTDANATEAVRRLLSAGPADPAGDGATVS